MNKTIGRLKRFLKKNTLAKKTYDTIKKSVIDVDISEITPLNARISEHKEKRINILIPSINKEHLFGGITTALQFFEQFIELQDVKKRIILTDAMPNEEAMRTFSQYKFVSWDQDENNACEIVPFSDRYNKTIPVGENDYFISTAWWTAFNSQKLIKWQSEVFKKPCLPHIYFIQDYEPGFYAWSSQYMLAESTYKYDGPQIGIFNTKLLKDYFESKDYKFTKTYYFNPVLNTSLKPFLLENLNKNIQKEKIILLYGRPSVQRNAFPIIVEALKHFVWQCEDINEWKIYSAGEKHPDIDLGNNQKISSLGKLTLEEYAELLLKSSVGISLMVSPHPSYPPLEMVSFGMKVITNTYDIKDLSKYNTNFISLDNLNPELLAKEINNQCKLFTDTNKLEKIHLENLFSIEDAELFHFISSLIEDID